MNLIQTTAAAAVLATSFSAIGAQSQDMSAMNMSAMKMDDNMYVQQVMQHHEQGIKMAEMAVDKANTEIVKQLATASVADQRKDMEELRAMQRELKGGQQPAGNEQMKQQMSASADRMMSKLESTPKEQFDTAFLQEMSKHHEMAIQMSRSNLTRLKNPEVKEFANELVKKQGMEQKEMQKLTKDLAKGKYRS